MKKYWLYRFYGIFIGRSNFVDLLEVLWQDFLKFTDIRKANEIPSLRFWNLTLQRLYLERHEAVLVASYILEVYYSFKVINTYRFTNQ